AFAQRPPGMESPTTPSPTAKNGGPDATNNETVQTQAPSKQESKAIKAFRDTAATDADKKTQLGEDFVEKYPQSRYRPEVVNWLARAYASKGQIDKLQAAGDKEMTLTPPNPVSLAVLGSNLARAVTPTTPDEQKHLAEAEAFCKKSLDTLATAQKPSDLSDEKFTEAKNETSAVAYSGIGTVAFRNQKYADAVTNLDQSIKFGGGSDPVNYYLLGKANEASSNFDQALAAYTKCAAIPGGMQAPCQSSITQVKAHGAVLPK
ncbi:MAG: tetratricopeptide repeat protein, partial [Candidatus Acidiferrum sp.]